MPSHRSSLSSASTVTRAASISHRGGARGLNARFDRLRDQALLSAGMEQPKRHRDSRDIEEESELGRQAKRARVKEEDEDFSLPFASRGPSYEQPLPSRVSPGPLWRCARAERLLEAPLSAKLALCSTCLSLDSLLSVLHRRPLASLLSRSAGPSTARAVQPPALRRFVRAGLLRLLKPLELDFLL